MIEKEGLHFPLMSLKHLLDAPTITLYVYQHD